MDDARPPVGRDVAIIGAGPSGLTAAIAAAQRGARVTVLERLPRMGAKLLASGGGRCNVTNTLATEAFMARLGRQGRFMSPALERMDPAGLRKFLAALGVETHVDGRGVYPGGGAQAVLRAILRRCGQLGVEIRTSSPVTHLRIEAGRCVGIAAAGGPIIASAVIVACGGRGYPELGGSAAGYEIARQAGHKIVEPAPALVPLVTAEGWPKALAGLSVPDAAVRIDLRGQAKRPVRGAMLFTHRGISGPAVLDVSGDVAAMLAGRKTVPLRVSFVPEAGAAELRGRFDRWRSTGGRKAVRTVLAEIVPAALAAELCAAAGLGDEVRVADLRGEARDALIELLTNCPLTITATEGWARAMVTRGGVALREVDPRTLESRLVRGLYFCGEVLDLDGPSGGFNLQWAFASGHLAGEAARAE